MKTKIERLKFGIDLDWKLHTKNYKKVLDELFNNIEFYNKFSEFLHSIEGKNWLEKDGGKKYLEWQHE